MKFGIHLGKINTRSRSYDTKGKYTVDNPNQFLRIFIRDGTHTNPYSGQTMSNIDLAKILHFGAYHIPARPFYDDFVREKKSIIFKHLAYAIAGDLSSFDRTKKTRHISYDKIGEPLTETLRSMIKEEAYYRQAVPNATSTILRKKSDIPLVDTGALVNAVAWKVMDQ